MLEYAKGSMKPTAVITDVPGCPNGVAVDSSSNLYVTFIYYPPSGPWQTDVMKYAPGSTNGTRLNLQAPGRNDFYGIAADSKGQVAVAWDTYRNGSYDVYARIASSSGSWGAEIPVAATDRYEAYPSIAYDPRGRLWIAYEESSGGWGKDWGAHVSDGVPLYWARAVRLVGLDSSGRLIDPVRRLRSPSP